MKTAKTAGYSSKDWKFSVWKIVFFENREDEKGNTFTYAELELFCKSHSKEGAARRILDMAEDARKSYVIHQDKR